MVEEKKEKLDFLKREEIKTMARDVARLRALEAQKERKKISSITPQAQPQKDSAKSQETEIPIEKKKPKVFSIPEPIKKSTRSKKILIRGVIVFISVLFLGAASWFIWSQRQIPLPEQEIEQEPELQEEPEEKPIIHIPGSLILVQTTQTPEISDLEELPAVLQGMMEQEILEGESLRIAAKNIEENRMVSLQELAAALNIEVPQEIYPKISSDYTLAVYSQAQGKRVVFATMVKEHEGLIEILKSWEDDIEQKGMTVFGKEYQLLNPKFRTSFYKDIGFRYLTISSVDFGLCYAYFDNYFVITSSFESFKNVVDTIQEVVETTPEPEINNQIGQLFVIGFDGKIVTPELEELFKQYKPGGVLLLSKNIESQEQLKKLTNDLQSLSLKETGLPLLIAVDQEGGIISRIDFLEEKTAQSEIETPEQAFLIGQKRGQALKELGINLNLAPLLDSTQEGDFIFERSFQKTPEQIGEIGKALVQGQKTTDILTAIKHFPGYGTISSHPEEILAQVETLPETSQFKKAIEANPELVMTANVIYKEIDPSLPFTFSSEGIQVLRDELGINLLIISDDLDQNSLLKNFTLEEIVVSPIKAGVDIIIFSGWRSPVENGLEALISAFERGEISETIINGAVSKIINFKQNSL